MTVAAAEGTSAGRPTHASWVRVAHWIATVAFVTLAFSGVEIFMVHPRLYWGEVGNDLTPALLELPVSRNYQHGGWSEQAPFFQDAGSPMTASRTYDIFNQNGWGRSLHFLAAWFLVLAGAIYLVTGAVTGHFRRHLIPRPAELSADEFWRDVREHVRLAIRASSSRPEYGLLQKCTYVAVVFFALPLIVFTGLAMSPAIASAYPSLPGVFGGLQSARTIHFAAFVALILFLLVHVSMVFLSGFARQMRGMTFGA